MLELLGRVARVHVGRHRERTGIVLRHKPSASLVVEILIVRRRLATEAVSVDPVI